MWILNCGLGIIRKRWESPLKGPIGDGRLEGVVVDVSEFAFTDEMAVWNRDEQKNSIEFHYFIVIIVTDTTVFVGSTKLSVTILGPPAISSKLRLYGRYQISRSLRSLLNGFMQLFIIQL